jgi:hypothetical protein
MAVHFYKLVWYKKTDEGLQPAIDITDAIKWDVKKGVKATGASFGISLKNNWNEHIATSGERINQIAIQPGDIINVYADINPITESANQLVMVGQVMTFESDIGSKKRNIKLKCSDKSQIVLNKIWSKVYGDLTAPELIERVLLQTSQNNDSNQFGIDTSGITFTRPVTDGGGGDEFPDITFGKNMKPVYDWINELSQIEYTNTGAEQVPGETLVCQRAFMWYLDENNKFFWFYPDDAEDYTYEYGVTPIYKVKLKKDIFGVINMVIVRGGTDKNGNGVTWYHYDEGSDAKDKRMKVLPRPRLADIQRQILQNAEETTPGYLDGELSSTEEDTITTTVHEFPPSGYVQIDREIIKYTGTTSTTFTGLTRGMFGTSPATHANNQLVYDMYTYGNMSNGDFRQLVKNEIKSIGANLTARYGSSRWKGSIEVRGAKYAAGDLINLTVKEIGCVNQKLRIIDVHQQMTKKGWFTTLKLEEDENLVGN